MHSFLLRFSPWPVNTRCGFLDVGFFLEGGRGGLPLFLCPLFSPLPSFLAEVSPFTNPHTGNISISSLSTINHRQNPPPALAPERETFPPPRSLPKQAALQMDGSPLSIPFASLLPVPARGKEEGREQRHLLGAGHRPRAAQHHPSP